MLQLLVILFVMTEQLLIIGGPWLLQPRGRIIVQSFAVVLLVITECLLLVIEPWHWPRGLFMLQLVVILFVMTEQLFIIGGPWLLQPRGRIVQGFAVVLLVTTECLLFVIFQYLAVIIVTELLVLGRE